MSGLSKQVDDLIDAFVGEVTELIRRAAVAAAEESLGGLHMPARGKVRGNPRAGAARGLVRGGGKRSADEIANTASLVEAFVGQNPGRGVEQIGMSLEVPTKELLLPIKKLLAARVLRSEGQKRATKYFPAVAAESPATPTKVQRRKPRVTPSAEQRGGRKKS